MIRADTHNTDLTRKWGDMKQNIKCKRCGSIYERDTYKVIFRDKDEKHCEVCDELLEEWNGSRIPTFKLVRRADWPKSGSP